MSDINDIFERLKGQKPVISNPDELTDLIMDSLPDINEATEPTGARVVKMRWWMAAAASLIIIIGIGTIWMFDNEQPKPQRLTAHHSVVAPTPKVVADLKSTTKEYGELKSPVTKTSGDLKTSVNTKVKTEEDKTEKQSHTAVISNLHYAVYTPEEDSAYQAPSRMVEFINKIADYNNVKAMPLMCALGSDDSTAVSVAYVFEDNKELNLFSRLLQAACWYESKTPGYLLNFSHQQFFFTLKDLRKNEKYLWIAERIVGGRILLFCSQSPIEADVSSACYQNYREQLMHANYSTSNF
ncbi:MAG: hypothetical protein IJ669_07630 [Prevotella sp.]|nr:hypothetical protein [Prevotella sp.]